MSVASLIVIEEAFNQLTKDFKEPSLLKACHPHLYHDPEVTYGKTLHVYPLSDKHDTEKMPTKVSATIIAYVRM